MSEQKLKPCPFCNGQSNERKNRMLKENTLFGEVADDSLELKAALALDLFTKLWCRVEDPDDLKFRCKGCPMELQDKSCAAKLWKKQNAPHYRNFGSMGDL